MINNHKDYIDNLSVNEIKRRLVFLNTDLDFQVHNRKYFEDLLYKAMSNPNNIQILNSFERMINRQDDLSLMSKKRPRDDISNNSDTPIHNSEWSLLNKPDKEIGAIIQESNKYQGSYLKSNSSKLDSVRRPNHEFGIDQNEFIIDNCIKVNDYNNSNRRVIERVNSFNEETIYKKNNINPSPVVQQIPKTVSPINNNRLQNNSESINIPKTNERMDSNNKSYTIKQTNARYQSSSKSKKSNQNNRPNNIEYVHNVSNSIENKIYVSKTINLKNLIKLIGILSIPTIIYLCCNDQDSVISQYFIHTFNYTSVYVTNNYKLLGLIIIAGLFIITIIILLKKLTEIINDNYDLLTSNCLLEIKMKLNDLKNDEESNSLLDSEEFINEYCFKKNIDKEEFNNNIRNKLMELVRKDSNIVENKSYTENRLKTKWKLK